MYHNLARIEGQYVQVIIGSVHIDLMVRYRYHTASRPQAQHLVRRRQNGEERVLFISLEILIATADHGLVFEIMKQAMIISG